MTGDRELLDRGAAAEYIGVSLRTLARLVSARQVEFVKLGPFANSPVRFERTALDAYLERRVVSPRVHTGVDRARLHDLAEKAERALAELRCALAELGVR